MCNPPFYSSRSEVARSAEMKELPPNGVSLIPHWIMGTEQTNVVCIQVCTGADTEMIYPPGGEAAFIGQMVDESERYAPKCRYCRYS